MSSSQSARPSSSSRSRTRSWAGTRFNVPREFGRARVQRVPTPREYPYGYTAVPSVRNPPFPHYPFWRDYANARLQLTLRDREDMHEQWSRALPAIPEEYPQYVFLDTTDLRLLDERGGMPDEIIEAGLIQRAMDRSRSRFARSRAAAQQPQMIARRQTR